MHFNSENLVLLWKFQDFSKMKFLSRNCYVFANMLIWNCWREQFVHWCLAWVCPFPADFIQFRPLTFFSTSSNFNGRFFWKIGWQYGGCILFMKIFCFPLNLTTFWFLLKVILNQNNFKCQLLNVKLFFYILMNFTFRACL